MTVSRRDRITAVSKRRVVYADFSMDFDANPVSLDLQLVTNEDAVGQSIRNIVLTMNGERPFNSSLGSKVNGLLFEPIHGMTEHVLRETIVNAIVSNEPRAQLLDVAVDLDSDDSYGVSVTYMTTGSTAPAELNFLLKRVR